jgi:DNA-binding transcriptional LysR family regulator
MLNQFATATSYQTLRKAAEHRGITQSTLVIQINHLECDIRGSSLERAERRRLMRPTRSASKSPPPLTGPACLLEN